LGLDLWGASTRLVIFIERRGLDPIGPGPYECSNMRPGTRRAVREDSAVQQTTLAAHRVAARG